MGKGAIGSYVHNTASDGLGRIGVLVALELAGKTDELAALGRQLAMHVASANPQALDQSSLDPAVVKREKDILADKFRQQGKPDNVIDKIVESGLKTFYKEACMLEQPFIFDDKKSVAQAVKEAEGKVGAPIRSPASYATGSARESRSRKPTSPPKSRPPPVIPDGDGGRFALRRLRWGILDG